MPHRPVLSCVAALGALLVVASASAQPRQAASGNAKPNIVLILADDLGYGDVGAYGSELPTPNLDALAREGARFTNWYVSAPVCTPSRYSLLTARTPTRSLGNLEGVLTPRFADHDRAGLQPGETTLATLLKRAGYRTYLFGKWHLGGHADPRYLPTRHGFDRFYGHTTCCVDYWTHRYAFMPDWYRNETLIHEEGYLTDLQAAEAVRLLDSYRDDEPFFLYLPFSAVHYGKAWTNEGEETLHPLQAKPEDVALFEQIEDPDRRLYAAMLKALDDGVGEVLDALDRNGFSDDTWVIFFSDNGASLPYGGSNEPLRGEKGTLFEGGIRVPSMMRWPGRIAPGTVIDQPVWAVDLLPTISSLVGVEVPASAVDGHDMSAVVFEGEEEPRDLFWRFGNQRAYRRGAWKYLQRGEGAPMLFDLDEDPSETDDLSAQHPEVLRQLVEAHRLMERAIEERN